MESVNVPKKSKLFIFKNLSYKQVKKYFKNNIEKK